ncbi:MAG: T9SS type A sorting domain-containing protein, partial [Saprospiraceae bacterium]|nr:T9SS type A sorting domain-containing protein [Saprospiraceae bacterium]
KCGVLTHLDYWSFGSDGCEENSKYVLEIKQTCVPPIEGTCFIDPALVPLNAFEQIGTGYYRCEFWVVELDTLAPELVCKGNKFFDDLLRARFESDEAEVLMVRELGVVAESENTGNQQELRYESPDLIATRDGFFEFNWDFNIADLGGFLGGYGGYRIIPRETLLIDSKTGYGDDSEDPPPVMASDRFVPLLRARTESDAEIVEVGTLRDETLRPRDPPTIPACVPTELLDLFARLQWGRERIPLREGDVIRFEFNVRTLIDVPSFLLLSGGEVSVTGTHDCTAKVHIPPAAVEDDWSGVKVVKARMDGIGTAFLTYDSELECYTTDQTFEVPHSETPYWIFYEAMDSCHNYAIDSCYIMVKDLTRPVPVSDKGVTVSLSDKKVWVDAETFDEGSWDNCGINFLLVRRSDWAEACVDLCYNVKDDAECQSYTSDDLEPAYFPIWTDGHDTLWCVDLETDKNCDAVEAHYAKQLEWLCEDGQACRDYIYNGWQYDLIKFATQQCAGAHYVDDQRFRELFKKAMVNPFADPNFNLLKWLTGETPTIADKIKCQGQFAFDCPESATRLFCTYAEFELDHLIDEWQQIGGGWAGAVPFSCEDACGPVTVELLVMDYWCNWGTAWTEVWVEDKTPVQVVKDVVDIDDDPISCKTYKEARYSYPGEIHPVSLEYIVEKGKAGDADAFDQLDAILGGYCKAWVDPYGNYVDADGAEIECDIPFEDSQCYCKDTTSKMRVYDEHLGYYWKDSTYRICYYDDVDYTFQKGIVVVNCAENVYCEQEVWCDIDHCGEGYIFRKWKIWQSCPPGFYSDPSTPDSLKHPVDTIFRHQKIRIGNTCPIDKGMFDVPGDMELISCDLQYGEDNNVIGDAGPENTGYATYKFDDDCRLIGIAHEDKVFKIVGGDAACYKIIRTWYFADWCTDGPPSKENWWNRYGYDFSCEQKIIVRDTTPPVCAISGPVTDGGQIEVGACAYNLVATVDVSDACGVSNYYWEIKDIKDESDPVVVDSGDGALNSDTTDAFTITSDDLSDGVYKLVVTVVDECNNEGYCEYFFEVVSIKKPAAVCVTHLTARLNPMDLDQDGEVDTAMVVVWAEEFNSSSEVACDDEYLEYRIEKLDMIDDSTYAEDTSYIELGCDDFGTHLVRMWVISQPSGTVDFCDVVLTVQSDFSGCINNQSGDGGGEIGNVKDMQDEVQDPSKEMMDKKPLVISGDAGKGFYHVSGYGLEQNRPNPFRTETTIGFVLAESGSASITIYDITGKVMRSVTGDFSKGYNE